MESQLEILKRALQESEAEYGPGNPFVKGLKAQIARLEKPRAENPIEMYSAGVRAAPSPRMRSNKGMRETRLSDQPRETEAGSELVGALRIARFRHQNEHQDEGR